MANEQCCRKWWYRYQCCSSLTSFLPAFLLVKEMPEWQPNLWHRSDMILPWIDSKFCTYTYFLILYSKVATAWCSYRVTCSRAISGKLRRSKRKLPSGSWVIPRLLGGRDVPVVFLTRAPLGYSAERAPLGGQILPPLPNSRTDGRRKTGKTANESSQQDKS